MISPSNCVRLKLWWCSLGRRHIAAAEGAFSVVQWLIEAGADVNPLDRHNRTPLEVSSPPRLCALGALIALLLAICTQLHSMQEIALWGPTCFELLY